MRNLNKNIISNNSNNTSNINIHNLKKDFSLDLNKVQLQSTKVTTNLSTNSNVNSSSYNNTIINSNNNSINGGGNQSNIERLEYETINLEDILNDNLYSQNKFCEAFFVTSIPKKNAKLMPESEEFISVCQHKECSILPAYKPEITHVYKSIKNKEIHISSTVKLFYFIL
jgi:hypothetical protein